MKCFNKALSIMFVLLLMLSYASLLSLADEILVEGDYEYTVTDGEATITKYIGEDSDMTVPSMLGGFTVTAIGDYAFYGNTMITSVTISEHVTYVGARVFEGCLNLVSVSIPSSIKQFGEGVFYDCVNLNEIALPQGITEIPESMFCGCASLETINIPSSVTTIGQFAFASCINLSGVLTIPEGVTEIGYMTFLYCMNLTGIILPESITVIEEGAFNACNNLAFIEIPGNVTSFGFGHVHEPDGAIHARKDVVVFVKANTDTHHFAQDHGYPFVIITEYTTDTAGDINGDENIDAQDALLALQHSVRLIDLRGDSLAMADMNQDDSINAQDALQILQRSVGL